MPNGVDRFNLGQVACCVFDETLPVSEKFPEFANATEDERCAAARAYTEVTGDPATIVSANMLLIDNGDTRALIDTGSVPINSQYGTLPDRLQAVGYDPQTIDLVVFTHGDEDHIAGSLDAADKPAFPNARYRIAAAEWHYITSDPTYSEWRDPIAIRRYLTPLGDRLEQIDSYSQITPQIRAVPAPGHTPGQIALRVGSGVDQLLVAADAVHHPLQVVHPEWYFPYDADSEQDARSRRGLLAMAAHERMLVLNYHFTFPGLGYVVPSGDGWSWRRIWD